MLSLKPDECRVLGVLVEKAQTTPAQYPMTLNSLLLGANQKNNRDPVTNLSEDAVLDAVDGLRAKGLVREAMLSGSRVAKYRHVARETLAVNTEELVVLTELLLRGPQSLGEIRGRASRMHPLESLEAVQTILDGLMQRPEPMVRRLAPSPGSRAVRYAQLFCPDPHPLEAPVSSEAGGENQHEPRAGGSGGSGGGGGDVDASGLLAARVDRLEADVAALRRAIQRMAESLGSPDPLAGAD